MLIFFAVKSELFLNFAFSEAGYILMFLFFQKSEPLINMVLTKTSIKWSAVLLPCSTFIFEWDCLSFLAGKQGSSPNKGQSPIECDDFPSICLSIYLFPPLGHPARPGAQPARSEAQHARPEAWGLAGWAWGLPGWAWGLACWASGLAWWLRRMTQTDDLDGWTNGRKFPHSTRLCPLSGHRLRIVPQKHLFLIWLYTDLSTL